MYLSFIFLAISFLSLNANQFLLVEVIDHVETNAERDILLPGKPGPATTPTIPISKDKKSGYRRSAGHRRWDWLDELQTTPTPNSPPGMNNKLKMKIYFNVILLIMITLFNHS